MKKLLTFGRTYGYVRFDFSISVIGFKYVQGILLCLGYFARFLLNLLLKLRFGAQKNYDFCASCKYCNFGL